MISVGEIQRAHPNWNIVDAIPSTDGSGGIWAVGADGGVFALDGQGNPSGATKNFGAYTGLPAEQRQGTRSFVGIRSDPTTGGYTLISNQPGQNYSFKGDRPVDTQVTDTRAPGVKTDFNDADLNHLTGMLKQFGLGDLVDEAWNYYKDPKGGAGDTQAVLDYLPTTQAYQDHFPGLKELAAKGNAWTPANWNEYYNAAQEAAVAYGIPLDMVDRTDVGKMLTGGVSRTEFLGRIQAAGQSVYNADPIVIQKLRDSGLTQGDLTAFYLDADRATPLLQRKAEEGQARIQAAAQRTSYDPNFSLAEAQGLQKLGVDEAQANQGFTTMYNQRGLYGNELGDVGDITRQEQLAGTFGNDAAAQAELEARRAARKANFQGGGGAAAGGAGKQGIG